MNVQGLYSNICSAFSSYKNVEWLFDGHWCTNCSFHDRCSRYFPLSLLKLTRFFFRHLVAHTYTKCELIKANVRYNGIQHATL